MESFTVSIPGLAADQFDGGSIGQAARFGHPPDDLLDDPLYEAWRGKRRVRAGKGYRVVVELGLEAANDLRDSMEALEIACEQNLEYAAARACRTAVERIADKLYDRGRSDGNGKPPR